MSYQNSPVVFISLIFMLALFLEMIIEIIETRKLKKKNRELKGKPGCKLVHVTVHGRLKTN